MIVIEKSFVYEGDGKHIPITTSSHGESTGGKVEFFIPSDTIGIRLIFGSLEQMKDLGNLLTSLANSYETD